MPKTQYSEVSFWEEKYKQTICEHYEWLSKPEPIFSILHKYLHFSNVKSIIDIGCGTSHFLKHALREIRSRNQSQHSFDVITALDFSKEVIKKLRTQGCEGATYVCMDVRDMKSIEDSKYDLIIDKGTMDCLFCEDQMIKSVLKAMRECYRILKEDGSFIIISHGKPKFRNYLFRNKLVPFNLQFQILPRSGTQNKQLYIYICTKGEQQTKQGAIMEYDEEDDQQQMKNGFIDNEQQNEKKQEIKESEIVNQQQNKQGEEEKDKGEENAESQGQSNENNDSQSSNESNKKQRKGVIFEQQNKEEAQYDNEDDFQQI